MALLSRAAENLFWIGRYVERAENIARLLDAGKRMSAIPGHREHQSIWEPILAAAGCRLAFDEHYDTVNQQNVVEFLGFARTNPSSIVSCIASARGNARSVRTALTFEMWDALNSFWLDLKEQPTLHAGDGQLAGFIDKIKTNCALYRGVTSSTILHNDTFDFLRLGHFIERADCTSRLLDVKYYALLAPSEEIAGSVDVYQWTVILRAAASFRAYHWVYGGTFEPLNIADFLILNIDCARSLAHCMRQISEHLDRLARLYAAHHSCQELASEMNQSMASAKIGDIFEHGLHEFLSDFIVRNNRLSTQIASDYYFVSQTATDSASSTQTSAATLASETQTTA